jgi:Bacterial Ig-like domain (group 3)
VNIKLFHAIRLTNVRSATRTKSKTLTSRPKAYRFSVRLAQALASVSLASFVFVAQAHGQATTFAGNAQHTGLYNGVTAQPLNTIKWTTQIDSKFTGFSHYGMPVSTAANTIITPDKISKTNKNGTPSSTAADFQVNAFDGTTGIQKYTLTTDYLPPAYSWVPSYNICLAKGPNGPRLYYPNAGGVLSYVDGVNSDTPTTPKPAVFYTSVNNYLAGKTQFDGSVFINTPVTADSNGNLFFGFRIQGKAPAPFNGSQLGGYARIDANGNGSFVFAGDATGDPNIINDVMNAGPALSNDEKTVYVVCKGPLNGGNNGDGSFYGGYLVALDSATLATKSKVFIADPRPGYPPMDLLDDSTSSPMVAPDGDVFFGSHQYQTGSRGFLLHYSADLSVTKIPGDFGWDNTPSIVPASMVPSYTGPSSYLLFCKYNNYLLLDGDGVNRVAILDPNSTQIDFHPVSTGLPVMREVQTLIGPTPNKETKGVLFSVREWCINAGVVNPGSGCVYFDSEDGHFYSWNLATNSISQALVLTPGVGEPYVPSTVGPDGAVYTLNGSYLFATGKPNGPVLTLTSSSPDVRNALAGDPVTFTASLKPSKSTSGGTVTFTDLTYFGLTQTTTVLAANVPVNNSGKAQVTSGLVANDSCWGSHFITATYNAPNPNDSTSATMVQKVHANSTTTSVGSSASSSFQGQSVTITATVTSSGNAIPTGYVTFSDGNTVLAQIHLDGSGTAAFATSSLAVGIHNISVTYASDTTNAASSGSLVQTVL